MNSATVQPIRSERSQFQRDQSVPAVGPRRFRVGRKDYKRIPFDEQVEVRMGRQDGSACGAHLLEGHVRLTLGLVIRESPQDLERAYEPESGWNLIKPSAQPSGAI